MSEQNGQAAIDTPDIIEYLGVREWEHMLERKRLRLELTLLDEENKRLKAKLLAAEKQE